METPPTCCEEEKALRVSDRSRCEREAMEMFFWVGGNSSVIETSHEREKNIKVRGRLVTIKIIQFTNTNKCCWFLVSVKLFCDELQIEKE